MNIYHTALAGSIVLYLKDPLCTFLYRCKVVNFFVDDLWDKIPESWREALSNCTSDELPLLPTGFIKDDFPDSLKLFIERAQELSIPREKVVLSKDGKSKIFKTYNLSPKKEHELAAMGPVIKSFCEKHDISWCIDIGAGQGYLSQMLVHQYGLNVLALDQSENNIQQSIQIGKRESRLKEKLKDKKKHENDSSDSVPLITPGKYVAATLRLTKDTTLDEILQHAKDAENGDENSAMDTTQQLFEGKNFLLTGLHCCGGLTPTILKIFASHLQPNTNLKEARGHDNKGGWKLRGIVLLSCCYHLACEEEDCKRKIMEDDNNPISRLSISDSGPSVDFPMSHYVKISGITLGTGARLLACYASDKWPSNVTQRKKLECAHAFRAALQVLLMDHYKEFCANNDTAIGHIGEKNSKTFYSYAKFAITQKLKLPFLDIFSEEYLENFWSKYEKKLPTISMFWNLRAVLSPVIESLILTDRQLYLEEKDISSALIPMFDPAISPRNMAIIAPF